MASAGPSATPPNGDEQVDLYGEFVILSLGLSSRGRGEETGRRHNTRPATNNVHAELLGVDKSANANDIKKAYRKVRSRASPPLAFGASTS